MSESKSIRMNLPDYMVIGAQKAGTTWLWDNMVVHPRIEPARDVNVPGHMDYRKEIHFWTDADRFAKGLSFYQERFADKRDGCLIGDHTPTLYAMPEKKIKMIAELVPNIPVILILRNPVERALSCLKMMHSGTHGRPYLDDVSAEKVYEFLSVFQRYGAYSTALALWRKYFNVSVFFYEDLKERPYNFLNVIFETIGVEKVIDWTGFPIESRPMKSPSFWIKDSYMDFLKNMFRAEIRILSLEFGDKTRKWIEEYE